MMSFERQQIRDLLILAFGPFGNKLFKIPSGNELVYFFSKTHVFICL